MSDDLLQRLRRRGWRLTPQRSAVVQVFRGDHVHLTAEAVHARAQELLPELSLATVYNTLNELVALGEVQPVSAAGGPRRYDPNIAQRHQHLICDGCGELRDVTPGGEESLRLEASERNGYALHDVEIVFHGTCPGCQQGR